MLSQVKKLFYKFGLVSTLNPKPKGVQGKVFVGLSGGVDSSVSAYLLKKAGFDVTGVFIKVWQPEFVECTWKQDRLDAMRVCAHLNIPFLDLDLEEEYKKDVFDYMIREYKSGRTPNPDVMCNKFIKFGGFLKFALQRGADAVATGHYARNINNFLYSGLDQNKDQSYFLWTLSKDKLEKILFPIGHLEKSEVRKIAKRASLLTFNKKDSQGLCFVGKIEMKEFLERFIEKNAGDVLNTEGEIIGRHDGSVYYTLGQRHGFEILKKGTEDKPYFVVSKDLDNNTITVSNIKSETISSIEKVILENTNWTEVPKKNTLYKARLRYRQPLQECFLDYIDENSAVFKFEDKQDFVSSGQSLVLYDDRGEKCLGGGIIV